VTEVGKRSWGRRIIPVLVVIVALGIIAGGAYVAYSLLLGAGGPADEDVARASQQVEDAVDEEVIDDVREVIADTHEELNQAFGYGGLEDPDYAEIESETVEPVRGRLADIIEDVDDPALERDLGSVDRFLELGIERGDDQALAFAHRVLHDLDYFAFNPNGDGRYWGATITLEGEENEAQAYLSELESGSSGGSGNEEGSSDEASDGGD
jgi:hypothetical protein